MRRMPEGQQLLATAESSIRQFCYWPTEHHYTLGVLFAAAASLNDEEGNYKCHALGRPIFLSNGPGTGKTLSTDILCRMIPGGKKVVNPTSFGMQSLLNFGIRPGFDEFDKKFGPRAQKNSELMSIVLAGYERDATVIVQRSDKPEDVNVGGPMILNGNNATLVMHSDGYAPFRDRGYIFLLEKPPNNVTLDDFDPEIHSERLNDLRNWFTRWGRKNHAAINNIPQEDLGMDPRIRGRQRQIWRPLFRVAKFIGGDWLRRCYNASRAMVLGIYSEDDVPSLTPADELLMWARTVYQDGETFLPTRELCHRLMTIPNGEWWQREWKNPKAASMGLARIFGLFGIENTREYVRGIQERGYKAIDLEEDETTKTTSEQQDNQDNQDNPSDWDWSEVDA